MLMRQLQAVALCALAARAQSKASVYRKPPMGWMSWEHQGCQRDCVADPDGCISASLYRGVADVLVEDGYAAKGYTWIDVDDCFLDKRDPATNQLQADETRFPGGIRALSEYVHSKGLHLGIYNDIGPGTCAGDPGLNVSAVPDARADEQLKKDVQTFASWGIDSLKVDGCGGDKDMMHLTYPKLGAALNATGRQIWYSCSWPVYESLGKPDCNSSFGFRCLPWQLLTDSCNSWRIDKDIMDTFYLPGHSGVRNIIEHLGEANETLSQWQRPGAFNDPDMILVGNNGLSTAESKIQFGMWSMFSAPLLMSNDIKSLSSELKDILQNDEVIAVDQDSLGLFPESKILSTQVQLAPSTVQLWHKKLYDGSTAVALVNFGVFDGQHYNASFTSDMVGMAPRTAFKARDLFAKVDLGAHPTGAFQAMLDATSILMLKLTPLGVMAPSSRK